jgi:hypothetical protein
VTATNSVVIAKDGNAASFNLTFAAESISGNKAQGGYLKEPVGETLIIPAQNRSTMSLQTPTVTSNGVYTSGFEIGGLMTFPVGGAGTGGCLTSITVTSKSILATGLVVFVFAANPASSTWTDHTSPAINTADVAKLLCTIPLNIYFNGLGTMTVWDAGQLGMQFSAANLYAVIIASGSATLTSSSTGDFTVQLGMKVD